jgi:hypothetical protein
MAVRAYLADLTSQALAADQLLRDHHLWRGHQKEGGARFWPVGVRAVFI